jgi:hypothetical protein
MQKSKGFDYKHKVKRKNWPVWQCNWGHALRPTTTTAEAYGREQSNIGIRSSAIDHVMLKKR